MPERRDDDVAAPGHPRRKRRSWARRRHLGLLTTATALLVLVVGVLLVVLTWDNGRASFGERVQAAVASASAARPATTAPTTSAAPSPAGTAPSGTAQVSSVKGKITAVGVDTWTLAGTNGIDYTVVVDASTAYKKGRTFGSFKVGDTVSVKGALDQGTLRATAVTLQAAAR